MNEKKDKDPVRNPIEWLWHAALLLLGAIIALNVALSLIRPILPWLAAVLVIAAAAWLIFIILRWHRNRW
jgi:membrane protein YdbS with pleckstrin-like domain